MTAHHNEFRIQNSEFRVKEKTRHSALVTPNSKGFTLIELLIAISIVAILSVIAIVVFSNVQKGARDSKRKGDIDAISKAMEVHYGEFTPGYYSGLCQTSLSGTTPTYNCEKWFAGGKLPVDPQAPTKNYCLVLGGNPPCTAYIVSGQPSPSLPAWKLCATLESGEDYCKSNAQ